MNVVDVYPKEVHANLEISIQEIAHILTFYDDARPLYDKVFSDSMGEEGEYMENEFIAKLRQVFDNVQKGM
jgi:hypothetical protein